MKSILLALGTLAVLCTAQPARADLKEDLAEFEKGDSRTYFSSDIEKAKVVNFKFHYPRTWDMLPGEGDIVSEFRTRTPQEALTLNLVVIPREAGSKPLTAEERKAIIGDNFQKEMLDLLVTVVTHQTTMISGVECAVIEGSVVLQKGDDEKKQVEVMLTELLVPLDAAIVRLRFIYSVRPGVDKKLAEGYAEARKLIEKVLFSTEVDATSRPKEK